MDTPGHSRGGVTYSIAHAVFPGDLILYHETGFLDYPLASKDAIVGSIRKLHAAFPDAFVLLSGHGEASTIGFEKKNNRNVTEREVKWAP
jgi:hydroxyacylglutathione hydrolase